MTKETKETKEDDARMLFVLLTNNTEGAMAIATLKRALGAKGLRMLAGLTDEQVWWLDHALKMPEQTWHRLTVPSDRREAVYRKVRRKVWTA